MNLNGKMKKLQKAIVNNGFPIKVVLDQFYSEDQKRMINIYSLQIIVDYQGKDGKQHKKWYEILRTCSMPDIIFSLVDIYKAVSEWQKEIT